MEPVAHGGSKFQFLVVSDLHIGAKAKPAEFKPDTVSWDITKGFLHQFEQFVDRERIQPNLLIVSGDITNAADPREVKHASKVIEWIAKKVGLTKDEVVAVPGNHDLHWAVSNLDEDGKSFWSGFRFAPFTHGECFLTDVMARKDGNVFAAPFFQLRKMQKAVTCAINSAAFDFPTTKPHRGSIIENSIAQLDTALRRLPPADDMYRICVVHHHPLNYSDLDQDLPDFSALVNAENLVKVLTAHRFDFLVHGHKHVPFFTVHSRDGATRLPILGAGSFSANLIEPLYQGRIVNQLHIIDFNGRDPGTKVGFGRVKSWAHIATHGWVPSKKQHHGIPHLSGFGKYHDHTFIENLIRRVVGFQVKSKGFLEGRQLFTLDADLSYVPTDLISAAIEKVGATDNWKIVGTIHDIDTMTILSGDA